MNGSRADDEYAMYNVVRTIYLCDDQNHQLRWLAHRIGISKNELIRRLLDRALEPLKKESSPTLKGEQIEQILGI